MKNSLFFEHLEEQSFEELFINNEYPYDVLLNLNNYIEEKTKNVVNTKQFNNVIIGEQCLIGNNCTIYPNVVILGPVIIGDNVEIMSGAVIRPYSLIGDNCSIGHASEIKHSILMNNAKVASLSFVGDSIIGYKSRIGSGTILSNRRFDQANVTLKYNDEKIDLKSAFFGSIVGDKSRLGAHVTTYPGTFIGHDTWIFPNTSVKGFIPSLKRVSTEKVTDNQEYDLKN